MVARMLLKGERFCQFHHLACGKIKVIGTHAWINIDLDFCKLP